MIMKHIRNISWLIFRLLHSNYAINTRYVSAVLEVSEIVKVVDAPDYIEGLIQEIGRAHV